MYKDYIKRVLDLLIGLIIFTYFIFVFIVVGIAILLDDGGPVIYSGKRLGRGLKEYKMYKFRSMKVNVPDIRNADGSTFNSETDSRLTRVGKIIRKLSIDEIPQIINVIRGDMSFIGPRPSPIGNEELYSKEYLDKFKIRPGLTGYTQAYYRNGASVEEKQKSDLFYVDNISFIFDIKIALKTILTVLKRKGVYTNANIEHEDVEIT
jgi:lipopolysaccharide/colanic/teichoic acid biosynthesis glycosyltransferase